jgi:hypothetical protein
LRSLMNIAKNSVGCFPTGLKLLYKILEKNLSDSHDLSSIIIDSVGETFLYVALVMIF